MQEDMRDFAIKLFGKTIISFPPDHKVVAYDPITVPEQRQSSSETSTSQDSKDVSQGSFRGTKHDDDPVDPTDETLLEAATSSEISDGPNTPSLDTGPQEKTLKKPDKIIPCPRCNSMDTKFCYYNNYNVSQPRHFCKKCQRYWTAGGTMRNVPVGSGRRKSKNASIVGNYDHINGIHLPSLKPNGNEFYEHSSGPTMGPPGFPVTFYPTTPYWACAMPGSWNGPWALAQSPGPNSSTLGKHSREGNMLIMSPSNLGQEKRPVLMPKTLRIHDPSDAAKSSIWSTLGMKNGKVGSTDGMSLFKAFESKGNRNVSNIDNTQMVLQANPAALSRSLNFNERL